MKMDYKILSLKGQPFCAGDDELKYAGCVNVFFDPPVHETRG